MAASYHRRGMNDVAVFELFVRRLPPQRKWLLAAGLGPALVAGRGDAVRAARARLPARASGSSGRSSTTSRSCGSRETSMRCRRARSCSRTSRSCGVTAPRIEGQLLETLLLNQLNFQTAIATKAAPARDRDRGRHARQAGTADRLLAAPRSRRGRGCQGGPLRRDRRRRGHLQRGGRDALRPAAGRHDGPLLRDVLRARAAGVHRFHGGHARTTRSCSSTPTTRSQGCGMRSRPRARSAFRWAACGSTPETCSRSRRRPDGCSTRPGMREDPDHRQRRPRRGPDREAGRGRRADRPVGSRHGSRYEPRRPGRRRGVQARRRPGASGGGLARHGQDFPRQGHPSRAEAGLPPLRGRARCRAT